MVNNSISPQTASIKVSTTLKVSTIFTFSLRVGAHQIPVNKVFNKFSTSLASSTSSVKPSCSKATTNMLVKLVTTALNDKPNVSHA